MKKGERSERERSERVRVGRRFEANGAAVTYGINEFLARRDAPRLGLVLFVLLMLRPLRFSPTVSDMNVVGSHPGSKFIRWQERERRVRYWERPWQ